MDYSKQSNNRQRKTKKSKKNKVANTFSAVMLRIIVVGVIISAFMATGAAFGAYIGIVESVPEIHIDEVSPEAYTSIIYDSSGNEIDRLHGDENREYVKLSEMGDYLPNAIIAIEDERYYTHNGVDFKGMARALYVNVKDRSLSEGASTITQQLIKINLLKDTSKKFRRKLQEQYIAIEYEKALTKVLGDKRKAKDYIMEIYLNSIALGHGNNGVKAAAKYYFNKEPSDLTLSEAAVIVGTTNNPTVYSPKSNPENNDGRRRKILGNMLDQGMITQAEHDEAVNEDSYSKVAIVFENVEENEVYHSYFVDQVINDIANDLVIRKNKTLAEAYNMIYSGGLKINTTIDMNMQATLDEKFKDDSLFPTGEFRYKINYYLSVENSVTGETTNHETEGYLKNLDNIEDYLAEERGKLMVEGDEKLGERYDAVPQPQAAMVVMDFHNGQVKALTGGRGDKSVLGQRPLNRSTQSPRQPGSVFKVLTTYAPGIDSGKLAAATMIEDKPLRVDGHDFKNWWGASYKGPMSVRQGIVQSANVVTVRALMDYVGLQTSWDYLMNFGFTTLVEKETRNGRTFTDMAAASALGGITDGVTVMELTGAYGAIANKGMYNTPILYTTVYDHNDQLLLDNTENEPRQVMNEQAAYIITDIMEDVITDGSGTGGLARFRNIRMPVSGKTGTTSDDKDLVFAGYTPYYASAIWMGHDIPKSMSYSQSPHLRLWRAVMEEIHEPLEYKTFERPDGIVSGTVCGISGLLPSSFCSKRVTDMFLPGTVPSKRCNGHSGYYGGTSDSDDSYSEGDRLQNSDDNNSDGSNSDNNNNNETQQTETMPEWLNPGGNSQTDNSPTIPVIPPAPSQTQNGDYLFNPATQMYEWSPSQNNPPVSTPAPQPEEQPAPQPEPQPAPQPEPQPAPQPEPQSAPAEAEPAPATPVDQFEYAQ